MRLKKYLMKKQEHKNKNAQSKKISSHCIRLETFCHPFFFLLCCHHIRILPQKENFYRNLKNVQAIFDKIVSIFPQHTVLPED